jgi:hypothetical protein
MQMTGIRQTAGIYMKVHTMMIRTSTTGRLHVDL